MMPKNPFLISLLCLLLALLCPTAGAEDIIAFSLREAERQLKAGSSGGETIKHLGGMTRVIGGVVDESSADVIVMGGREAGKPPVSLDDLVVALRARLVHHAWPLVSIDRTAETAATGQQKVRFEGGEGIARSSFGKALLDADVVLKKLGLRLLSAEIWGVRSYFDLCAEAARSGALEEHVGSRFWFRPPDSNRVLVGKGVIVVHSLRVGVQTEVMSVNGQPPTSGFRDKMGDRFAEALSAKLADVGAYHREVARLNPLYGFVVLAKGLESQATLPDMGYWLKTYRVPTVDTPATYPLLRQRAEVTTKGGAKVLDVDGGIELQAAAIRLRDGDATALREVVLRTRPSPGALTWKLPVSVAKVEGLGPQFELNEAAIASARPGAGSASGTYITRTWLAATANGTQAPRWQPAPPTLGPLPQPSIGTHDRLPSQAVSTHVGGVMLAGAAGVQGAANAAPDLSGGGFGLIVEGATARLAPDAYRRFITALWAVYFSKQAPGVSIDPIGRGVSKHLVRYIGNVINTDLARVMRDADYRMKQAAVGTHPLEVPGFQDVDQLTARHGTPLVGASRRFWFVPENMLFRRDGSSLLFDSGHMHLHTEFLGAGGSGRSEPADRAFAAFFSKAYGQIAKRYPVYDELFEYAKLVGLATYLKERKIPLLWFLLANKDLVLTEDSPGTVDALAKGSRHDARVTIEGGVDLAPRARYVADAGMAQALAEAASHSAAPNAPRADRPTISTTQKPAGRPAANAASESYAIIPDQLLTGGESRRGLRFQTDLALHRGNTPGLELVRTFDAAESVGEFGAGWRVLVPYHVRPADDEKVSFRNVRLPKRMVVENRLTGRHETLTFSTERYSIAGYVPDALAGSEHVGLFVMSNGSFRLADKLGSEFWFDPAGTLTDMILPEDYRIHFDYLSAQVQAGDESRLRLDPASEEKITFRGARLPARLRLKGGSGPDEILRFSDKGRIIGYEPEAATGGRTKFAAILSDGSFRLLDMTGNELAFDAAGIHRATVPNVEDHLVRAITLGKQTVTLEYELDAQARPRVARAEVGGGNDPNALRRTLAYAYDESGRLARVAAPRPAAAAADKEPASRTSRGLTKRAARV
jgi:hypothetical protein